MPYADNEGARIHYEVEGKGPPLILLHGLLEDLGWWRESGWVDALRNDYLLVLIDARGHGASDKPHDPDAYALELLVGDVVAVLDDLKIRKAHFLGFSMGGWVGFGFGELAQELFHSLIIGAMSPYSDRDHSEAFLEFLQKGRDHVKESFEEALPWLPPELKARSVANDFEALIAFASKDYKVTPLEDVLSNMTLPCLLFVGESDPFYPEMKRCAPNMPNATLASFPNLGHVETLFAPDLIIPRIKEFLDGLPRTEGT